MRVIAILLIVSFVLTGTALAQKPEEFERPKGADRLDCITEGYDAYMGGTGGAVPDADILGITFGPLMTSGSSTIVDVILDVNISATWVGDVRLSLLYDADCDGYADVTGEVLCRLGLDGCPGDDCCGCSGDLNGWYGFDESAVSIELDCPSVFAPGCYGPDYDSSGLHPINGWPSGGCFWLFAADGAGGDATSINAWDVFVLTEVTPVEESTWGVVKAMYR